MNHTYQPSGKISPLFWPAAAGMFVITAFVGVVCTFGIQASHATLLDMMIYFTITECTAKFGAFLCVKVGRVRKPAFARVAGMVLALWYWLLLLAFYTPVREVLTAEKSIWIWKWGGAWKEVLAEGVSGGWQPWLQMLWRTVLSLKEEGAVITGKSGNILFTMPGVVCVALLGILFLAAVWQFGFAFWKQGRAPFCEGAGKWAKKTVVNLQCRTEETFLSRLLLGDTTVLAELEPLGSEEADCYFSVSVFAADESDLFYASVSKMTKVQKRQAARSASHSDAKPKRQKKPVFAEEQVAEYLVMDRITGFSLLSRSRMEAAGKSA